MLQYHFSDWRASKPYVGVGINFTKIAQANLASGATLESHSWGKVLQAGLDVALDKEWLLNFDLKKIYIQSDVDALGSDLGRFKLAPAVLSLGLGYRY